MKIRILNNSIRLRLSQPEVENLKRKGKVEARTEFGGPNRSVFIYSLEKKKEGPPDAVLSHNHIRVFLAEKMIDQWADTDQVGIKGNMPIGNGEQLRILVEKDFKCLTERNEDESKLFPNPAKNC